MAISFPPRLGSKIMGKIDVPAQSNSESTAPKDSGPGEIVTDRDEDVEELFKEKEGEESKDWEDDFGEDELKLTNEAVRMIRLKKFLDIDGTDTDYDKEVKGILSWARRNGIKNRNMLFSKLTEIKTRLGVPHTTGDRVKDIYTWCRLQDTITTSINKQQMLENNDRQTKERGTDS